jgi:FKBP-type peptidyl-prolyl cis-trans isomerase FklB
MHFTHYHGRHQTRRADLTGICNLNKGIVWVMKKSTPKNWLLVGGLLLLGVASSVNAQTPPASNTPPAAAAPNANPAPAPAPTPDPDQISYLFGLIYGAQMHGAGIGKDAIVPDAIVRGINEGLQGKQPSAADQQQIQQYVRALGEAAAARNKAAAKDFLAHNAHEKGVVTTASGLQYKILSPADKKAAPIAPTDKVTVEYRGKLLDGSEFDSSYLRGVPATFPVNGVIKGWQEALVLMRPGAKWQLFVPPELAYGAAPRPKIPPNSLLIFDVTVLSAEAGTPPLAPPPGAPPAPKN